MNVAITGGSGFIGEHVVAEMRKRGHTVHEFDRREGYDVLTTGIEDHFPNVDMVIHLAGVLGTSELFGMGHQAIDVNIKGTFNVLQSAMKMDAKYLGITMPSVWSNLYQVTRRAAKDLATAFYTNEGLPVMHVLAFNAFGHGQHVRPVQKIIPTFAHRAWREEPIPIWGDGSQIVDLISAQDIAKVFADVAEQDTWNDTYVEAGTGHALIVNEIADFVLDVTGSSAGVEYLPMRKGEQGSIAVASGIGWTLLNTRPFFDWDDLADTIEWYREDRP